MRRALPLLLVGCQITGTIGRDDPNGGSGGGTLVQDTEMVATGAEVGGTAEGGGTGSDVESTSTGESSESTASIPHACIPTPDDSECSECRKVQCCDPLVECLAHEPCTCFWECIQVEGHSVEDCALACDTDHALYEGLETCTHGHCPACP